MHDSERILRETVAQPFWDLDGLRDLRAEYVALASSLKGLASGFADWEGTAGRAARLEVEALQLTVASNLEALDKVRQVVAEANTALYQAWESTEKLPDTWIERTVNDVVEWVLNEDCFDDADAILATLAGRLSAAAQEVREIEGVSVHPDDIPNPGGTIPEFEPWANGTGVGDLGWAPGGDVPAYPPPSVPSPPIEPPRVPPYLGGEPSLPSPWVPTPWEPGPGGELPPVRTEGPALVGGRDEHGYVAVDDAGDGRLPGGSSVAGGLPGSSGGSGMGLAAGLAGGALGAGALGAAGLTAMRGGMGGLGALGGLLGGGGGVGGGVGAGLSGAAGAGRGLAGGLSGAAGAGAGAGTGAASGAAAGGAGQAGARTGGMMGGGGMAGGGAGKDKKGRRHGAGGPLAPSLDDDPDFVPRSEGAEAGGRGEDGA